MNPISDLELNFGIYKFTHYWETQYNSKSTVNIINNLNLGEKVNNNNDLNFLLGFSILDPFKAAVIITEFFSRF